MCVCKSAVNAPEVHSVCALADLDLGICYTDAPLKIIQATAEAGDVRHAHICVTFVAQLCSRCQDPSQQT
jgi:hypothetical protein